MSDESVVDVLVIGAGLSGIGVAARLARESKWASVLILERREAIGGTWDLFRYPGIRSDSDMYTFGFDFKPWHGTKVLADGTSIREYVQETAREYGLMEKIRFGRWVTSVDFSTDEGLWTVTVTAGDGAEETYRSRFLVGATGYYDYDEGYQPTYPGQEDFEGDLIHPQHWPEDLDYRGKRVVVIGSGATAITLVPSMADDAEHVTMLQRSPSYVMTVPAVDPAAAVMGKARIPASVRYKAGRIRNIALNRGLYVMARSQPEKVRWALQRAIRAQVGDKIDMKHFTPTYDPWDQRLCVVPNGDLFRTLKSGRATVVTDTIETFTPKGIALASGEHLDADIVISATGLNIQVFGGASLSVDGKELSSRERVLYKGVMLDAVPNMMIVLGYTNISWTLKVDIAAKWFCQLVNRLRDQPDLMAIATATDADRSEDSLLGSALTSGYIRRGDAVMPRQGTRGPWKQENNYYQDVKTLGRRPVEDEELRFVRRGQA